MANMIVIDVVDALKRLNMESMDMDDMIALFSAAEGLKGTYDKYRVQVPEYVGEAMSLLDREIKAKRRDYLLRQKKLLDAKEQRLMSREEQREDVRKQKAEIDEMLKE